MPKSHPSYLLPEQRVHAGHPLRDIKTYADLILAGLSAEFDAHVQQDGKALCFAGAAPSACDNEKIFYSLMGLACEEGFLSGGHCRR